MRTVVNILVAAALAVLAGISLGTWATYDAALIPVTSEPMR